MVIKKELTPKLQVEALLFSSGRTMSEEQLAILTKLDISTVKKSLEALEKEYIDRDSAIVIFNDPTGWKMMVRDLYIPTVKNIVAETELTRACMETLAVIAYKYPKVMQSEVIDIRGGGAYEHMAELEKLGFINREPSGRSYAVKLTEKFFNYFDVAGGKDIRAVFKNVKVPQRVTLDAQKTLGDLQVIDVKSTHPHHSPHIDGLSVVDVPPAEPKIEVPEQQVNLMTDDEKAEHGAFLDDLDSRIARLQERNNVNDNDETLKRKPLPGADEAEQKDTEQS